MKSARKNLFLSLTLAFLLALQAAPAHAAATITTVDGAAGFVGEDSSLVLNASGFPVISYYDSNDRDLKVAVCGDATCSAGNTISTVDGAADDVGRYSSIKLNASGFPVISYWDETNGNLRLAVCGNATCSAGGTITTVDSAGDVGEYTSLELNASGFPVISYYDSTNSDPKVAICTTATCSFKSLISLDGVGSAGTYTSLELSSSGFPVVSYSAQGGGSPELRIVVCTNSNCTLGVKTTLDAAGGYYNSLELSSSGIPIISYQGSGGGALKVAVCGDATCSAGNTTTTIDSGPYMGGTFSSLALDAAGIPFISYYDSTNGDLKMVACGDATCSSGNGIATVDSGGNVGNSSSLAINAAGFPVVSYYDSTNGDLKYLGVTSPLMAGYTLQSNYSSGPTTFSVTFGENVNNAGGGAGADDVTNPNNYKIINLGPNGVIETASCAVPLGGDDILVTPSNVAYIPNTAIVTLSSPLPGGSYRLFVCGTTSITSLLHFPINGGADYTIDFTVAAASATTTTPTGKSAASSLPKTGFAPNKATILPAQSADSAYSQFGDLWLEIPSLNVKSNIVGVPQNKDKSWDVTWLGNDIGWLNGTAFPTWNGNSVLTAHVTNASGLEGPFAALKSLKYGDQIIVHMGGAQYIYEVSASRLTRPYSTGFAFQSLQDHSYLTLITCQGYDSRNETYLFRRVVRAVLIEVK